MSNTPRYGDILSHSEYELVAVQPKDMRVGDLFYDELVKEDIAWIANPLINVCRVNEYVTQLTYRDMYRFSWGKDTPRLATNWTSINPVTKIYRKKNASMNTNDRYNLNFTDVQATAFKHGRITLRDPYGFCIVVMDDAIFGHIRQFEDSPYGYHQARLWCVRMEDTDVEKDYPLEELEAAYEQQLDKENNQR